MPKQHLEDLNLAIETFLGSIPNRTIRDNEPAAVAELERIFSCLEVPPRISILAGEAIHQTRSALDHIASALVVANKGVITPKTQFPIFVYSPTNERESHRYEDQIRGMSPSAKALIDQLQPFNGPDRLDHPLTLLKRLNNFDKHQALLVAVAVTKPLFTFDYDGSRLHANDPSDFLLKDRGTNVQRSHGAYVVFPQFGTATNAPVFDAAARLWAHVTYFVRGKFKVELTKFPWEK